MFAQSHRIGVRVLTGAAFGMVLAALYAGLVAVVHLAVHWRWDRAHLVALAFVSIGAAAGVLGGAWACSNPRPRRRGRARVTMAARLPLQMRLTLNHRSIFADSRGAALVR